MNSVKRKYYLVVVSPDVGVTLVRANDAKHTDGKLAEPAWSFQRSKIETLAKHMSGGRPKATYTVVGGLSQYFHPESPCATRVACTKDGE